ncbi:hypothetical protein AVEN_183582-1 [Araneus ventricosus]|uniref:Uncharacterized protein n=1 Tax=Araneus ventricosus TaxID=182803 RepID=A0A4Y2JK64_ARAVE|nr:hypothetical protein AVEN_183582-1 [Araneus ventricosus]
MNLCSAKPDSYLSDFFFIGVHSCEGRFGLLEDYLRMLLKRSLGLCQSADVSWVLSSWAFSVLALAFVLGQRGSDRGNSLSQLVLDQDKFKSTFLWVSGLSLNVLLPGVNSKRPCFWQAARVQGVRFSQLPHQ